MDFSGMGAPPQTLRGQAGAQVYSAPPQQNWWDQTWGAIQNAAQGARNWWDQGFLPVPGRNEFFGREPLNPNSLFPTQSPFASPPVGPRAGPPVAYDTRGGYQQVNQPGFAISPTINGSPSPLVARDRSGNIVASGNQRAPHNFQTFYQPSDRNAPKPSSPPFYILTRQEEGAIENGGAAPGKAPVIPPGKNASKHGDVTTSP